MKEPVATPKTMFLVALNLVEGLLHLQSSSLQFDLHQWQPVDEDGDIVTIFVTALVHCYLLSNLIAITQRLSGVEEFEVDGLVVLLL